LVGIPKPPDVHGTLGLALSSLTIGPTPLAMIFAESIGELISDLKNYCSGYSRKSKIFPCISLWIVASL